MADEVANAAALGADELDELFSALSGTSRRRRQDASHEIALAAAVDAAPMVGHVDELIEALALPEAQTRWEALATLGEIALVNAVTELHGLQVGLVNMARGGRGLQIGLWNQSDFLCFPLIGIAR